MPTNNTSQDLEAKLALLSEDERTAARLLLNNITGVVQEYRLPPGALLSITNNVPPSPQSDFTPLIHKVLAKAEEFRQRNVPESHQLAAMYTGHELMKLVDKHGEPMMDAILAVDTKAATYAAVSLVNEDRTAFFYVNPNSPADGCREIAKFYVQKKNALIALGCIDADGSIQDGNDYINAALAPTVSRNSEVSNEVAGLQINNSLASAFDVKLKTLLTPKSTITANELNQELSDAGLPGLDKM